MTLKKEEDLIHANERGNGPKKRMEGGEQSDDLSINSADDRRREKRKEDFDKQTSAKTDSKK